MKNLKKRSLVVALALLFTVGGLTAIYAGSVQNNPANETAAGYTCPVTGGELPCPNCCPF